MYGNYGLFADLALYLAENLFRAYVVYRFLRLFFGASSYGKGEAGAYLAYSVLGSLLFLSFRSLRIDLVFQLISSFALTFLYRGKLRQRLTTVALFCATNLACEEIVSRLTAFMIGKSVALLEIIVPNLLLFLLVLLFEKLSDLRNGYQARVSSWLCTVFVPAMSIYIVVAVLRDSPHDLMAAWAIAGLLLMNVAIFYLMDHLAGAYRRAYEMELQSRQAEAYEYQLRLQKNANERMRLLRHDLKNHLIAIGGLAQSGDCSQILSYLDKMTAVLQGGEEFVHSGNVVLDSILNMKLRQAQELGAEIRTQVDAPESMGISDLDLNVILSNLLDNALRALKECVDKRLAVEIRVTQNLLYIKMENSYSGEIKQQNGKLETTRRKKRGHGIGLSSVKQTVERYNGEMGVRYDGSTFLAKVILYLQEGRGQKREKDEL